jgi:heptosyltransferase I
MKTPEKILIIKPSSLGDIVHSLPFLDVIKKRFSTSEIHWIVFKGFEGLLEGHPMIDRLWVVNKDSWKKAARARNTLGEISTFVKGLKKERFDLVIDLQGLLRSGLIAAATRAPMRIGFKEAREGSSLFYTERVAGGRDIHAVDRYLKIAEFLGCDISRVAFPFPPIEISSSFERIISSFVLHPSSPDGRPSILGLHQRYIVIAPGARWKTKKWPPTRFGELASMLPFNSVIVGGKSDAPAADEIVALSHGKAYSLAGKTDLMELMAIVKGSELLVTNDSGPMHIAAALEVPVIAVFGPTDPARTGPYGKGHTVIKADIACAPCFKKSCNDLKCMDSISAEKVFETIKNSRL